MEIISQATSDIIMAGASSNYICSMVRGRLQRNYHVCIRGMTDHKHIGRANMRWRSIMTGGLLETRAAMAE